MKKFIILASLFVSVFCYNYCDISPDHIACNNNGAFGYDCPSDTTVVNIDNLKYLIVDLHNAFRQQIASGSVQGFSSANKMATMQWDDELASLALLNAKKCKVELDKNRNTANYHFVGQNIKLLSPASDDPKYVIEWLITRWFTENKDANMSIINSYRKPPGTQIDYFTNMVTDITDKVGCGLVKTSNQYPYILTCDYSSSDVDGEPVYEDGPCASECVTGRNPIYPCLCSVNEVVDPNDFN